MLWRKKLFRGRCCEPIDNVVTKKFATTREQMIWPNTLCLLQQDLAQHWPESSALDNAEDFCLATLPIALPQKNLLLKIA